MLVSIATVAAFLRPSTVAARTHARSNRLPRYPNELGASRYWQRLPFFSDIRGMRPSWMETRRIPNRICDSEKMPPGDEFEFQIPARPRPRNQKRTEGLQMVGIAGAIPSARTVAPGRRGRHWQVIHVCSHRAEGWCPKPCLVRGLSESTLASGQSNRETKPVRHRGRRYSIAA